MKEFIKEEMEYKLGSLIDRETNNQIIKYCSLNEIIKYCEKFNYEFVDCNIEDHEYVDMFLFNKNTNLTINVVYYIYDSNIFNVKIFD